MMTDENDSDPNNSNSNKQNSGKNGSGKDDKTVSAIVATNPSPSLSKKADSSIANENEPISHQKKNPIKDEKSSPAEWFNAKSMPKMHSNKTKNNGLIPSIITLLIIIALLASAWTVYQQTIFEKSWATQQTKIDSQIHQQSQVVEQAKISGQTSLQAANQTQGQLNQLIAKNQQLSDSLYSTQEKVKALSGRQKQDWMLAEAAYLIKITQLQLSLQKDKQTAIQLLKTADRRIIEMADNSLLPIREGIAQDLSELSLIMQPDVTGIALALNAINQQIPHLSLLALQFEPIKESLESKTDDDQTFNLDKIYQNFLKDFVVIKNHSEPVKPLMTMDQRINLNSNIQLAIQQAQIALVQGNSSLYRLNISNAIVWINQFFKNNEKAKQVIKQLNSLKTKPIEVHYPDKLHAQKALDKISQKQLYHWLESSLLAPVSQIDPVSQIKMEAKEKIDLQVPSSKHLQNNVKQSDESEPIQASDPLEQETQREANL